jgi:hypothetical protein
MTPTTFGRPGATSPIRHVETDAPHLDGDRVGDVALPWRAGHESRIHRVDRHEVTEQSVAGSMRG